MQSVILKALILSIFICSPLMLKASEIVLTPSQAEYIAQKVWQNEGAGLDKYLIWWNQGEDYASLGIGHAIWFPKGHTERFREVFPMMLAYMQKQGVKMPSWLTPQSDFPWQTKEAFFKAKKAKTPQYFELFQFLKATFASQASFMVTRLNHALPTMLKSVKNLKQKARIEKNFYKVIYHKDGKLNQQGVYVLLDYTNFKGEGTLQSERYNHQGWGLLQVLLNMNPNEQNSLKAFAQSAKRMLDRRIRNSPPSRGEERWRKGWNIRLNTYYQVD